MGFSNADWDEISPGIPSPSDPFVQQYLKGRDGLIHQEHSKRSDASFRKSLSPIARRACAIVEKVRKHEQNTVWTENLEEHLAQHNEQTVFPGMMFMMAKNRMEGTKLWEIVRKMPKGCLLHGHLDAMVDFGFLLDQLLQMPGMHISSDQPLNTQAAREIGGLSFRYRAKENVDGSIWDESYKAGTYMLLTKSADAYPQGGRAGFLQWLKSRCTLSLADSHEQDHGIDAVWRKFSNCFIVCATIIHYEPMFRIFLRRMMEALLEDGVRWAELR